MVREIRADYASEWTAMVAVAKKVGIGSAETLRKWSRQMEIDSGVRAGVTSQESADLRKLRAENRELLDRLLLAGDQSPGAGVVRAKIAVLPAAELNIASWSCPTPGTTTMSCRAEGMNVLMKE